MHYPIRFKESPLGNTAAAQGVLEIRRTPGMALFVVWALLLAAGAGALSRYEFKGSVPAGLADQWPDNPVVRLDTERPTLLMFLHPRCPCSAASIAQLDRVLTRYPGRFRVCVLIARPAGVPEHWEEGANLEAARRLPDSTLLLDQDGAIAQRYGAVYSGTVQAFGREGNRLFTGGITASRGHEGESLGSLSLLDIGAGETPSVAEMPVFGCPLMGPRRDSGERT